MRLDSFPTVHGVPAVSAAQMAEADRMTIEEIHIPADLLMENAARQIARAARAVLGGTVAGKRIVGLIGSGNNGADAAAALRHLINWGAVVVAHLAAAQEKQRESTRMQIVRLLLASNDGRVAVVTDASMHEPIFDGPLTIEGDLVIDGLLGYSSRGSPRDTAGALADAANASRVPILAVDIPSGVDPDTGEPSDRAIRAAATVTLAVPKTGLLVEHARPHVGELLVADIGIPNRAFAGAGIDVGGVFVDGDLVRLG